MKKLLLLLLPLLVLASCEDDYELTFSKDELIGDIMTGREVTVESNIVMTTSYAYAYINHAEGDCTAKSSDENIVTASVSTTGKKQKLEIKALNVGNAVVSVTDVSGHCASLNVTVKSINEYTSCTDSTKVMFLISGVSKIDSANIVKEMNASKHFYEIMSFSFHSNDQGYVTCKDFGSSTGKEYSFKLTGDALDYDFMKNASSYQVLHITDCGSGQNSAQYILLKMSTGYITFFIMQDMTDRLKSKYPTLKYALIAERYYFLYPC
jgi:hypothetical protein